jgi:hypothetical protein
LCLCHAASAVTSAAAAAATGPPNDLLFRKVGDSIKVTDVQGFVANVNKHVAIDDNKTFHPVDKVLLPGRA